MSDNRTIRDQVVEYILEASDEEVDAGKVRDDTSLREDLDLSSMQAITMVMDLESQFDITVEDEEIEGLKTVGDVMALLEAKRSGGQVID